MDNHANVRTCGAALMWMAALCFPGCGPEDTASIDPGRTPTSPGDPQPQEVIAGAMHEGLGQPVVPASDQQEWKPLDPATTSGPNCVMPGAQPTLATSETNQLTVPLKQLPVCRPTTPIVAPVPPATNN